jgi:hypothetical protein
MVKVTRTPTSTGKQLKKNISNLGGKIGKVGWFSTAKYEKEGITVAQIAAIQEYGYPARHIPPRPFMRPTIKENKKEWSSLMEFGSKLVIQGKLTISDVMELVGNKAKSDIQNKIQSIYTPALAQSTILSRIRKNQTLNKIKGQISEKSLGLITKPLIDTGHMLKTLTNAVEND